LKGGTQFNPPSLLLNSPASSFAHFYHAHAKFSGNDGAEKISKSDHLVADAIVGEGYEYSRQGHHQKAIDAYFNALEIDPGNEEAKWNLKVLLNKPGSARHLKNEGIDVDKCREKLKEKD